eukprot:3764581-Rhodomonas_salina.1
MHETANSAQCVPGMRCTAEQASSSTESPSGLSALHTHTHTHAEVKRKQPPVSVQCVPGMRFRELGITLRSNVARGSV